ncbi:MAG TPA: hypothetical protein VMV59_10650 [Candidatus Dormibacteraeota bacterium]|nr:hypothetical protein [Candidatus Dormibacteraeota bacterium]
MTCAEFENIVHDLTRTEALDKATAVIAKFHAQTCERCAAHLAQAQLLALALDVAAEDSAQLEAPAHLETALVSAFREHHRGLERAKHRRRRARLRWLEWAALATAATVLLAIGAWNVSRPRAGGIAKTTSIDALVPRAAPAFRTKTKKTNGAKPLETEASATQSEYAQSDSTADFVPVPYSEGFAPGDSGVIVRVEMPRSDLADLGYSVDATRAADLVQVDLLVGEDGWPRAVRLVQ